MLKRKVRIIIACGAGIAQSTMIKSMITSYLEREKIPCEVQQLTFAQIPSVIDRFKPDVVYTAGACPFEIDKSIPQFDGTGIMTGVTRAKDLANLKALIEAMPEDA
jgi:PTS system galactitol-specific IIB component